MKIELASLPARMSNWSGGPDLNRRPSPWEGDILPLNYHRVRNKVDGKVWLDHLQ